MMLLEIFIKIILIVDNKHSEHQFKQRQLDNILFRRANAKACNRPISHFINLMQTLHVVTTEAQLLDTVILAHLNIRNNKNHI